MTLLVADLRAFAAAIRKELRTARRYPTQWLGLMFWPVLLPASYVLMGQAFSGSDPRSIAAFAERSGTAQFAGFVFVGFAMYMWLSTILWGPGTALRTEQMRGSLEAVFLTPTSRLVALFGPPAAALPTLVITFVVMGVAMWLIFGVALPLDGVLRSLVVVAFALPSLYAIGSLFAAGVLRFGEIGPIVQLIRGLFVLTCGITFPVLMLPGWAQTVAWVLPPTYIVQDIRAVLLRGLGLGDIALDLAITVGLSALLAAFAIVTFRFLERSARRDGMLGRY
ncbi:MAG TPA: ABC transporter permease [Candidatus Limnocylindria bacterium]|jgi:ABC-2 type transport system permease protein|nr:ABC transporter permease [Candidatus Limnocylindria bacterium]